jgi:vitamin B12 transporter
MRHLFSGAAMAALWTAASGGAFGQEAAEVIVVTASRTDLEPREVGSAITAIEAADFRRGQIQLVKDALQDTPGVLIGAQRPGGLAAVSIRGSDTDQVLFLIDGIELGDPSAISTAYQSDHLTSLDIERVEVLRGNQSSLYGSDAIGGVVNIVTQRALEEGFAWSGEAEAGSEQSVSGGASLLGRRGPLDFRLTATGASVDGPSAADPGFGPADEDDAYRRWSLSGRAGLDLGGGFEAQAIGFYSDTDTDLDSTGADSDDRVEMDEYGLGLQARHETGDGIWRNALTLSRYGAERIYFGPFNRPQGDLFDGVKDAALYVVNIKPGEMVSFAGGLNVEREAAELENGYSAPFDESIDTRAAFAEAALKPIEPLTVTLAARIDDHSRFGTYDTYRATAAYVVGGVFGGDLKLRASYGTGAKAPGLYQLFDPTFGNPDLDVETSEGVDAGADLLWAAGAIEVTVFDTEINNEIGFDAGRPPFGGYAQFGETRSRGAEFGARFEVAPGVRLSQSLTVLDVQDGESGLWRGRPRYSGSTSLSVSPIERLELTARARYRTETGAGTFLPGTKGFFTVDLLAAYALTDRVELYGRVVNVADEDYQLTFGGNAPDRGVFAGLRVRS